jgi:hypothetical protein
MEHNQVFETKYYVDAEGNFLGGFGGKVEPVIPEGAILVNNPPDHAWQKYDILNGQWLALTAEQHALLGDD